jgi:molybdenum cofactor synthesis domain-containing protein
VEAAGGDVNSVGHNLDAPARIRAHVITVSDGAFHRKREDKSGGAVAAMLKNNHFEVSGPEVVPDERELITAVIVAAVQAGSRLVITTGGTGLGPRDVTPQATLDVIDYEVPGLAEEMRRAGAAKTPMAALSRGVAGVRGIALVINLPGSPKGAGESLEAVMPVIGHALALLQGDTEHS